MRLPQEDQGMGGGGASASGRLRSPQHLRHRPGVPAAEAAGRTRGDGGGAGLGGSVGGSAATRRGGVIKGCTDNLLPHPHLHPSPVELPNKTSTSALPIFQKFRIELLCNQNSTLRRGTEQHFPFHLCYVRRGRGQAVVASAWRELHPRRRPRPRPPYCADCGCGDDDAHSSYPFSRIGRFGASASLAHLATAPAQSARPASARTPTAGYERGRAMGRALGRPSVIPARPARATMQLEPA
jgi:hypothetical protein